MMLVAALAFVSFARRNIARKIGPFADNDEQGSELQRRIENINAISSSHRTSISRELQRFDEGLSAETRAMRAALAAERKGVENAPPQSDRR